MEDEEREEQEETPLPPGLLSAPPPSLYRSIQSPCTLEVPIMRAETTLKYYNIVIEYTCMDSHGSILN